MKQPLPITVHGMARSEAVEDAVRKTAAQLDRFASDTMTCRVAVDLLQQHQHQGRPFGVRLDLTLPGHERVAARVENEDVYVALRDAFDDMTRKREDVVRRRRGDEKQHPRELHGELVRLNSPEGFGFIRAPDGAANYFGSGNRVSGHFDQLAVGAAVPFMAELAAQGPQAQRVSLGKRKVGR